MGYETKTRLERSLSGNAGWMSVREVVEHAFGTAAEKGWWPGLERNNFVLDPMDVVGVLPFNVPEKLMLIVSEVSEALEEFRTAKKIGDLSAFVYERKTPTGHDDVTTDELSPVELTSGRYKPVGFASELADIVIRVADLCGALGIDLERAVIEKLAFNTSRPHRHGGKNC